MIGPCLCGDLYCGSCGPAQGNIKCFVCGAWSMDGGCANPEKCAEAEKAIEAQMDRDEEERERYEQLWGEPDAAEENEEIDPDAPSSETNSGIERDWAAGYGRGQ